MKSTFPKCCSRCRILFSQSDHISIKILFCHIWTFFNRQNECEIGYFVHNAFLFNFIAIQILKQLIRVFILPTFSKVFGLYLNAREPSPEHLARYDVIEPPMGHHSSIDPNQGFSRWSHNSLTTTKLPYAANKANVP